MAHDFNKYLLSKVIAFYNLEKFGELIIESDLH